MSESVGGSGGPSVLGLLAAAEALLPAEPTLPAPETGSRIVAILRDVERGTPGGAALHAQLDTVAKWVAFLGQSSDHQRFGGSARVHEHVQLQFRLARAAVEDYLRTTLERS